MNMHCLIELKISIYNGLKVAYNALFISPILVSIDKYYDSHCDSL